MAVTTPMTTDQVRHLRGVHYNARVVQIRRPHEDLMVMRVRLDDGLPSFQPGQYTVLGLGAWEPRVEGVQPEAPDQHDPDQLIKRAYSISCSMLDDRGQLRRVSDFPYLEFYITLVRQAERRAPALTPRIFALQPEDRVYCGTHVHGHYGLDRIERQQNLVFAATGTGEAPHNAMVAEMLADGHQGRIVSVSCVRWQKDLAYLDTHRELQRRHPDYCYLPLTTREPENLDPSVANYVGKRYLQEYFASGEFEQDAALDLSPRDTHVFLCGSPAMIGVPLHTHDHGQRYPQPLGMVEVLERIGFQVDRPHEPGNIHFEKYW